MNYPYLDQLPLSEDDRNKLLTLAAPTPAALLGLIQANPPGFRQFFGEASSDRLVSQLEQMLDAQQRLLLQAPVQRRPALGAVISRRAPALKAPSYDLAERDCLFEELQKLRQQNGSPQTKQRIKQLEETLNTMLETAP